MARFRRKDLKRPDVFLTASQRAFEWGLTHQRNLMIGAGVFLAILVGIAGVSASNAARQRQANQDLADALSTFRAENYPDAATQLRTVADTWGSTIAGKLARLYAADAQLAAGNPDLAVVDLDASLADPPPAEYLKQQAALNLGYALESKADLAGAAERYAQAAAMSGPYRSLALLREARVREALGDKDRAEEAYEAFIRDFPNDPEVVVAEAKLQGS